MTWFLNSSRDTPAGAPALGGTIPGWGEQYVGAGLDLWKRRDSWGSENLYRQELADEMEQALGGGIRRRLTSGEDLKTYDNPKTRGHISPPA
ncbi:hypothetical protein [Paracoccus marinaquae]|uniref:Uncharacterized protein n=1 Tax=Paracoccus marinaquae TaxID=2841926 RepID=A0ABS6AME5_9RHOB|nr:hypothetical protein [Paracoccus marinaquae]MBU3031361.1 hypothetical protein [Paracoccus marinaquae]